MPLKKELNPRRILVHGETDFILEIPADVRMTFGPWSPPKSPETRYGGERQLAGTLRLYRGTATATNIVGLYTNVSSFRDLDVKHIAILALPFCRVCNQNLVVPGEDLCSSCLGTAKPESVENKVKKAGGLVF